MDEVTGIAIGQEREKEQDQEMDQEQDQELNQELDLEPLTLLNHK